MSEITVSVIVPMYNVEEYVVEMLNSLKSQKLKGIEFILIDDGSTDNTLGRVKKETSLDSRFKILATKNNGVSSARNTGIKNSLGRYIAFLDGDDCFCEDALEKLHSSAILTQAEITYGKIKRFDATNDWYSQSHLSHGLNQSGEKSILVNPELFYSIGPGAKLYKRSLLKDIRFPEDISFGEDQVVTFDTYVKAKKIICIPEDIYLYRVRATKDSATQSLKKNCINYMEDLIKVTSINLVSLSDNNQLTIDQKNIILSAYFERVLKYEVYPIFRVGLKSVFTKEKVLEIMNRWLENIPLLVKKNMPSIVNLLLVDLSKYLFLINGKNRDAFKKLTLNVEKVDSAKATKRNRDLFKQRSEYIEAKVIKRTYLRLNLLAKYIYRRYKIRSKLFIFYFYLGKALPIKKNLVVVATSRLNFSKGNLDEISKRLQKNDELRIETLKNFNAGFRENCKKYYLLSRAKVIIVDDYFYPLYNKPLKSKQNYVQVWHGAGAYKKFGYSALRAKESNSEEFERRAHSQYTHVITSSEWAREKFSEAFNINIENVLALGFPRTDQFFNQKFIETTNNKFKELFPNLIDKKIILYAPTFRGSVVKRRRFEKKISWENINLNEEAVILTKYHPTVKWSPSESEEQILDKSVSSHFTMSELIIIADVLITDYSSIIFEFSLLKKPQILYLSDAAEYQKERGFYDLIKNYVYDLAVYDELGLSLAIQEVLQRTDFRTTNSEFMSKFMGACDGEATQRLEKLVKNLIEG